MTKTILITGATGFIGQRLVRYFSSLGAFVKIITTDINRAKKVFRDQYTVQMFEWVECNNPFTLSEILSDTNAIINLAGTNVYDKRWNKKFKKQIYDSRVQTTSLLAESIKISKRRPECLIQASGVGIYGFKGDEVLDENSQLGRDFLADVVRNSEAEAMKVVEYDVRVVALRTGIVLGRNEGALKEMMKPFKFRFAAYLGSGKQWMSWVHIEDLISLYTFGLDNKNLFGAVNACSPNSVTNKTFVKTLAEVSGIKTVLPVPGFVLKIVLGEFANNLLTGQRVHPSKALDAGFNFRFADLKSALENIYKFKSVV